MTISRNLRIRVLALMLVAFSIIGTPGAGRTGDQEGCLLCHSLVGLGSGVGEEFRSLYVDEAEFNSSNHRGLTCRGCHRDIQSIPHAAAGAVVNCGLDCHAVGVDTEEPYSHEALYWKFLASVHGEESGESISCRTCHPGNPSPLDDRLTPRERTGVCTGCHGDGGMMARYHLDPTRVDRHLAALHSRAFWPGSGRPATCPDCHTRHTVLPSDDDEASTHPDRLAATCAGEYSSRGEGMGCHRRASTAFLAGMSPLEGTGRDRPGGRIFFLAAWILSFILFMRMLLGLISGR